MAHAESFSRHKQHFHLYSFHFRLRFSSQQPQLMYLAAGKRTRLSNRNSMCFHLNYRGTVQGDMSVNEKSESCIKVLLYLNTTFISLSAFPSAALQISELCEHIHSRCCVCGAGCVTNGVVSQVFFTPSCKTPLLTCRSFSNSPPHTIFQDFHLSCLIPFSSIIPLIPYSIS